MTKAKNSLVWIVIFSLLIGDPRYLAFADTNSGGGTTGGATGGSTGDSSTGGGGAPANVPGASYQVPSTDPTALALASVTQTVQARLAMCNAEANSKENQGILGTILDPKNISKAEELLSKATKGNISGSCYGTSFGSDVKFCNLNCPEPGELGGTCESFFGVSNSDSYSSSQKEKGRKAIGEAISNIQKYRDFQNFKMSSCSNRDQEAMDQAVKAYQCQQQVLEDAVSMVSQEVQNVMNQNQTLFGNMKQFTGDVFSQVQEIDQILGPEDQGLAGQGGAQFSGLLGVQKQLQARVKQMKQDRTKFKNGIASIKAAVKRNEQALLKGQMGLVANCFQGNSTMRSSSGGSLTCFLPMMTGEPGKETFLLDKAGNKRYSKQPCGPMTYLKTQVEQSAFKTGAGVIMSEQRQEESQALGQEFNAIANSMARDLGVYDSAPAKEGQPQETLLPNALTWSSLSSKYAQRINSLGQKTGVNLSGQMNTIASSCFHDGETWKSQQLTSEGSNYSMAKADIESKKEELQNGLDDGLSDLNQDYSMAMAALSGQAVSVDRFSCTKDNLDKMNDCYTKIEGQVNDLLNGDGASFTSKPISGGTAPAPFNVPGFSVPCKGINGCVTVLQQVRKGKMTQLKMAQKVQQTFINKNNSMVKDQLSQFGRFLGGIQGTLNSQFAKISQIARSSLGISVPDKPRFMRDPEQLKQSEPEQGPPPVPAGPYQMPGNMASLLSGMVQPTGLVDTQDNGVQDMVEKAQAKIAENKEKAQDRLDKIGDKAERLSDLSRSCGKSDSKESVGSNACGENACMKAESSGCSGGISESVLSLSPVFAATADHQLVDKSALTEYETALKSLSKITGCDEWVQNCRACVTTKHEDAYKAAQSAINASYAK